MSDDDVSKLVRTVKKTEVSESQSEDMRRSSEEMLRQIQRRTAPGAVPSSVPDNLVSDGSNGE